LDAPVLGETHPKPVRSGSLEAPRKIVEVGHPAALAEFTCINSKARCPHIDVGCRELELSITCESRSILSTITEPSFDSRDSIEWIVEHIIVIESRRFRLLWFTAILDSRFSLQSWLGFGLGLSIRLRASLRSSAGPEKSQATSKSNRG
jgi:hypothetical protein